MMIPKVIHYCWFGCKPLPEDVKRYIKTWKKYCPDYEIKEWNESNFDVKQNQYCREAYEAKKWAFVSDYVRLKVLYDYGGIYMDNELLGYLLSYYDDKYFKNEDGSYDMTTNVITITRMIKDKYDVELNNTFQIFGNNNAIFPFEYFCAKDFFSGKVNRTENTYTIHHFQGSWLSDNERKKQKIRKVLIKVIGKEFTERFLEYKRTFLKNRNG